MSIIGPREGEWFAPDAKENKSKASSTRGSKGGAGPTGSEPADVMQRSMSKPSTSSSSRTSMQNHRVSRQSTQTESSQKLQKLHQAILKFETLGTPKETQPKVQTPAQGVSDLESIGNALSDFQGELKSLLGETPFFNEITKEIGLLKDKMSALAQKRNSLTPEQFKTEYNNLSAEFETARTQLHKKLEDHSNKLSAQEVTTGSQFLVSLFKGIRQQILFETSSKVNDQMRQFQSKVVDAAAGASVNPKGIESLSKEQRLEAYGNVTYLRERSGEMEATELSPLHHKEKELSGALKKLEKTAEKTARIKAKVVEMQKELASVQKEIGRVKARYQDLRTMIDIYKEKFAFTNDEITSPEFEAMSIDAHRPTRNHLLMLAKDLFTGAYTLVKSKRENNLNNLLKSAAELGDEPLKKLCAEKPLKLEAIKKMIAESSNNTLKIALQKFEKIEAALDKFFITLTEQQKNATSDPRLGNNNLKEPLSLEKDAWKKQMKDADAAIMEMADKLKQAYVDIAAETGEFKDIKGVDAQKKAAGKLLTAARDDILNSRDRWGVPIDRTVRLSTSSQATMRHTMTCPNQGYASSAFRGRADDGNAIQPNWWNVELELAGRKMNFSRSAIQVEFFAGTDPKNPAEGRDKRMKATKRQVLEILSEKAERRFAGLTEAQKKDGLGATIDKPLVVKTSEVSLLSPDAIRGLLATDPKLAHLVKDKSGFSVDASNWERRLLEENKEAWMAFDRASKAAAADGKPATFSYVDGNGERRDVTAHVDPSKTPSTTYEIKHTDKTGKATTCFVQFDIAYYNVGCNQFTKLMTEVTTKTEINKKLEAAATGVVEAVFNKIPDFLIGAINTTLGRMAVSAYLRSKFGIVLGEQDLEKFFNNKATALERLLAILPAITGLLKSPEGKQFIKAQLEKKGIKLTDNELDQLSQLKIPMAELKPSPEAFLVTGLKTLKEALKNPGAQAILRQLSGTENKLKASVAEHKNGLEKQIEAQKKELEEMSTAHEENLKVQAKANATDEQWNKIVANHDAQFNPKLAAYKQAKRDLNSNAAKYEAKLRKESADNFMALSDSIPKDLGADERINIEHIAERGFPIIKALASNDMGRQLMSMAAAQKGKTVSAEELSKIKLPEEFTVKPGGGNGMEEAINKIAFDKHKERVKEKQAELAQSNLEHIQKIQSAPEQANVTKINGKVKEIAGFRSNLVKAQEAFAKNPSEANQKLKTATFEAWQKARNELTNLIKNETDAEGISPDYKAFLQNVHYEDNLIALRDEISDQLQYQDYRKSEFMRQNMYSLPSTIVALAMYLEEDPHTGCRSGKDRTSLQDMEISTKIGMQGVTGRILDYREMNTSQTAEVREQMLMNSGQIDDLAYKNIGSHGLNLAGGYGSYLAGFGEGESKPWEASVAGGIYKAFRRTY
jgi:hypothetical protein